MLLSAECKAEDKVYGISENGSFKSVFDKAMKDLGRNDTGNFLQINAKQSLNQFIKSGLTFGSEMLQSGVGSVHLFTDLNNIKNEMVREVLEFKTKETLDGNVTIHLDNAFFPQIQVGILISVDFAFILLGQ